ncbi:MAG: aminopeptidase P family protein [Gemmatimonadaceae bacterium]
MIRLLTLAIAAGFAAAQPLSAQIPQTEYAQRRQALAARSSDGITLVFGAPEPARDYEGFFQSSPFEYLTGLSREANAALVMVKSGSNVKSVVFVREREPAREAWMGERLGTAGVTQLTGLTARPIDELRTVLDSLARTGLTLLVAGELGEEGALTREGQMVRGIVESLPSLKVMPDSRLMNQLRGTKSPAEIELIRKAVEITVEAQRNAMRAMEPGMNEFEIQALIEYTFRRNGADRPSFATIVGSGPNSTTLHYNADDRFMNAGELVVMDIGASYRGYAADVTRTVPVSGTFTPDQRAIYEIVRNAQAAAERQAKVGARAQLMTDSSNIVIAAGLAKLGLTESASATFDCGEDGANQCPQYRLYYFHGLGHGIGLDVHDPEQFYFTGLIARGSAFTIEPGIYVRADILDHLADTPRNRAMIEKLKPAVVRYRNTGVRIEDDYIVTDKGVEWISKAPREIAEIEGLMRETYAGPGARNADVVNWYRKENGSRESGVGSRKP